jgi:hypothetical protein
MFQRNIQFLEDYLRSTPAVASTVRERVLAQVAAAPGIALQELFDSLKETASRDEIFALLVLGDIHADLHAVSLLEPEKVLIFSDRASLSSGARNVAARTRLPLALSIKAGILLSWDGQHCPVVNVGNTAVSLLVGGQTLMELPLNTLEDAIKQGRITIASQDLWNQNRELVHERLSRASESDLKIATERCGIVSRFLRGERGFSVPLRTVRRWVSAHQIAKDQLGSG